jgi:N6-L-threonylcarbamoyladenine synthase
MSLNRLTVRLGCKVFYPTVYPTALARRFTVLALESSADDTCAAVVNSSREILSNVVAKQYDLCVIQSRRILCELCDLSFLVRHEEFGGIHPMIAIEAHQRNMVLVFIPMYITDH